MSTQRVSKGGSIDFISSLPDEVLGKILSLVPTKLAASTSVLSKRWRNLLPLVENLEFNDAIGDPRGFSNFVDKTLALLTNSSIIKRFSLTCEHKHDKSRVDTWIRTVLKRGFSELHLQSVCMGFLETDSFTSNTLVKLTLTLSDTFYTEGYMPCCNVFFPKLKTLSLISTALAGNEVDEYLISGCPVLEELFIHYAARNKLDLYDPATIVTSPSVKRMTISNRFPSHHEVPNTVWLKTPSLVYLDYSSYAADQYYVDFGSLVEAKLDLRFGGERGLDGGCGFNEDEDNSYDDDDIDSADSEDDDDDDIDSDDIEGDDDSDGDDSEDDDDSDSDDSEDDDGDDGDGEDFLYDVTDLVAGISKVKTLHLSPDSLEVFHNLLTLSIESDKGKGWQVLPRLLNNSPSLETLVIKGLVHKVTDECGNTCVCIKKKKTETEEVCCLSTCHVKVLKISGYGGSLRELKQMRHFLRYLKCLENVEVKVGVEVDRRQDSNYTRITNALTKLPRVSSKYQFRFV